MRQRWILFIKGAGSSIDLGATMCRHHSRAVRLAADYARQADEAAVVNDWSVIADEFNRVARGERRPHRS